ncbi:hypothetical protein [Macrococcus animalis]|uniref:hypothetical protein n=1 Tax=Macrococcus animalis TaxID=3395467 RepID=UPI0039BDE7A3
MKKVSAMGMFWRENKHRAVVKYNAYRERVVLKGMSFEEALSTPPSKQVKVDDDYKRWSNIATENDISKNAFWKRVYRYGWSLEDAALIPLSNTGPKKKDDAKQIVVAMLQAGVPVPKKYKDKYPELFIELTGA